MYQEFNKGDDDEEILTTWIRIRRNKIRKKPAVTTMMTTKRNCLQTPEMEVFQMLMEFEDRGRYIALNAIANQLRYPSTHSHYFSCVMLFLFSETEDEGVKEQVTRVLLERLISHRPHPWALIITFVELLKNQRYQFWSYSFTRCATEIEKVFESVARSCMSPSSQPQNHRMMTAVGGGSEDR